MATLKAFFTGMVKDQEGNVSVQQIMGIIFAVILVVVGLVMLPLVLDQTSEARGKKLPAMSVTA